MPRRDESTIFNVARRMESAEARRVYLQVACGDDAALRQRIEALLRVHDEDQSFLTLPTLVKEVHDDLDRVVQRASNAEVRLPEPPPAPPENWLTRLMRRFRR